LDCAAPAARLLEPTQIAPESLTSGISAAANPPAIGSSGLPCATRLETTTTLTATPSGFSALADNRFGRALFPPAKFRQHGVTPKTHC